MIFSFPSFLMGAFPLNCYTVSFEPKHLNYLYSIFLPHGVYYATKKVMWILRSPRDLSLNAVLTICFYEVIIMKN